MASELIDRMYPTEAERQVLVAAEKLMEEKMASYDPSHDKYHGMSLFERAYQTSNQICLVVQRVRRTALALARGQSQKVDLLVVELAALLHDVLDKKYVSKELASDALAFFKPFFENVKQHVDLLATGQAALVAKVVENVSWTTERKLREAGQLTEWHTNCVELHCVQDADRLDAIGAFGTFHCLSLSLWIQNLLGQALCVVPLIVASQIDHCMFL